MKTSHALKFKPNTCSVAIHNDQSSQKNDMLVHKVYRFRVLDLSLTV